MRRRNGSPAPAAGHVVDYLSRLNAQISELEAHDTVVALTSAVIEGVPSARRAHRGQVGRGLLRCTHGE